MRAEDPLARRGEDRVGRSDRDDREARCREAAVSVGSARSSPLSALPEPPFDEAPVTAPDPLPEPELEPTASCHRSRSRHELVSDR